MKKFLFALLVAFLPFPGLSGCRSHRPGGELLASASAQTEVSGSGSEKKKGNSHRQENSSPAEPTRRRGQTPPHDNRAPGLRPIPPIEVTRRPDTEEGSSPRTRNGSKPSRGSRGWTGREEEGRLIVDDFEGELLWKPVSWTNANDCDLSPDKDDTGRLTVRCKPGKEEKAAIQLRFPRPLDLSEFRYMAVRARVEEREGEEAVNLAVGFQTRAYFESARLPVGRNLAPELRISLSRKDYKTSPDWEYNSPLDDRARVETIFLLIYYEKDCRVAIDEVYLGKEKREEPSADDPGGSAPSADREEGPRSKKDGSD